MIESHHREKGTQLALVQWLTVFPVFKILENFRLHWSINCVINRLANVPRQQPDVCTCLGIYHFCGYLINVGDMQRSKVARYNVCGPRNYSIYNGSKKKKKKKKE